MNDSYTSIEPQMGDKAAPEAWAKYDFESNSWSWSSPSIMFCSNKEEKERKKKT